MSEKEKSIVIKTETVMMDIDSLIPYPNNAKLHSKDQIETIANSIADYGFDQNIVIDSDNVIIKGHGRYLASKKLKLKQVPCTIRDDLERVEVQGSRLADNKVAEAPWDENILPLELAQLDSMNFDLKKTGFKENELERLIGKLKFSSDSAEGGDKRDDEFEDGSETVKMIQLFYDVETEKSFRTMVGFLDAKLKTGNISDAVFQALKFAAERM